MIQKESQELTRSEFKKLVCDIAVAIAPKVYSKLANDPSLAENFDRKFDEHLAYLSYDSAEAIRAVLKDRYAAKI